MIFGDGAFGRYLALDKVVRLGPMMELVPLLEEEETPEHSLFHVKTQQEVDVYKSGRELSPGS